MKSFTIFKTFFSAVRRYKVFSKIQSGYVFIVYCSNPKRCPKQLQVWKNGNILNKNLYYLLLKTLYESFIKESGSRGKTHFKAGLHLQKQQTELGINLMNLKGKIFESFFSTASNKIPHKILL